MDNMSKKLNANRSSMIRAELNKAQQCLSHIRPRVNVWEILAKNEKATESDIHLLYVQIANERNFYKLVTEHLSKAAVILENLKGKLNA